MITPTTYKYPQRIPIDEIQVESECLFDDMDGAINACVAAQKVYEQLSIEEHKAIIAAIRKTADVFKEDFALCAWSETCRGRYEHKLAKQSLAINRTPGVEDLQPRAYTGDNGSTMVDYAPYGVIGAVTPVTNPTATIINNAITVLSGGNGLVINAHPGSMRSTNRAIAVVNQAIVSAGGPSSLIAAVNIPTIPSGGLMMTHPLIAANLITGGPAVVKVALKSGKRCWCAGPGNPPVVVDATADIEVAAKGIMEGASFDNNMICSDEKEVFVVESVHDKLIESFKKHGCYILNEEETKKIEDIVFSEKTEGDFLHGVVDKDLVGANASVILAKIGVEVPDSCPLVICSVREGHPLVWTEQLMPVLPVVKCASFESAVDLAFRAEYGFKHTASIYSTHLTNITTMAKKMNTSIFTVNGSHYTGLGNGGEGYTSFSIAGTTGEGMTRPATFVRERRLVCVNALHFI